MATDSMSNLDSTHSNSVGNTDDGKQQKTLAERMSSLLENTPNSKADQLETPRWKRPLTEQCSQCGKMFSRAADLRLHMRTHTGERPYQCEICPKAFAQSSHLTKHRRVHTGERPYKCALCDLSFTQSSNLKKHVHTHFKVAKKKKPLAAVNDVNVGLTMQDNCAPNPRAPSVGNNSLNSSGNNRPFHKCKFCWRQFLSYTALQVHIKKHIRWPYPSLPTPSTLSSLPIPKPQSSIPVVSRESQHNFNQTHVQQHLSNNLTFPSSSLITAPTNVSYSLTTAPTNASYSLTTAPTNVSYSLTSSTPIVTDIIDVREGGLGSTTQNPNSLSNNPSKFYKCVKCPARYSDLGDFLNHMCYEHGSVFQCRLCPAFFVRSPDLEAHKNLHTLQARRELERDRTLEKPISTGEPSTSKVVIQSFQCNLCKIRFSSSDDFTRHLEAKHSKDKPPSTPNFGRSLTLAKRSLSRAIARQPVASISALQQHLPSRPLRRPDSRLFRPHWGSSTLHSKGASRESTLFGSPSLTNFRGSAVRRLVGLRRPHGCIRCGKSFLRPGDLRLHMRTHTGEKPFRCEMCPKAFAQTSHLTKHRRVHTGERPYKCSSCNLGFTQSSNLKKHVRIHFKPVSNNASSKQPSQDAGPSCWNSCSQNEENQGDGMSTKEELYPCPYCQLTFFMQSALNSHVAECTKSKDNICAGEAVQTETATVETPNFEQDQLFQTQFDLETVPNLPNQPDILQVQTPAKDNCEIRIEKSEFQNEVSNSEPVNVKQETDISELQDVKPLQIPLPAPQDPQINLDDFPAPIIPKFEVIDLDDSPSPTNSPSSSSFLSRPMPNFSQQEPSFASSTAPSLVSVAPMMESTTSTLTPTSNVSVTTASIFDSGNPRPHRCTVCGKTFVRSADIRLHMRTHTGERPFRCDICPKAFAQTSHLTKHRRVHTGERPYKCAICRLAFTQSSNLKKHVRTHARKFPDLTKPRFGTGAPAILPESLAANLPDPVSSQTEEAPTNPEIPSLLIDTLDDVDPSFVDNLEATIFESDGCVETKTELQPSVNITQTESASVCPGINSTLRQFQVKTEGSEISVTLPLNDQQGNENGYSKDNPDPFFPANFEDETNYTDLSESLVKQELPLSSSSQLYPVEMPMFQKTSEADIPNFNSSASFSKPPADQVEYLSTTSSDGQILTTVVQSITACNPFETVVIDIDDDNDDSSGNENISQEMHTGEKPYK